MNIAELSQAVATVVNDLTSYARGLPDSVLREQVREHPAAQGFNSETCDSVVIAIRQMTES